MADSGEAVSVILARIETKLDRVISDYDDHEDRIRALERMVYVASGVAMVVGGSLGTIASQIIG